MITIDGKEYNVDDMTEEQRLLLSHLSDLDTKLGAAQFNLDQLNVCRTAFLERLKSSLDQHGESEG